ncbi:MFS transporter [Kitasatospora sp. NPDC004615]|uniref:MFS transporter n=1 Tax=Kitasatospora sp. NPDC004615 TaxID=3364017 RepID=UPI00368B9D82
MGCLLAAKCASPPGPYATVQWIGAGCTLAFGAALITGGRLGDLFGRKRLFVLGAAGFVLASPACGLSPNTIALVGARVVQGLCAALMVPQVLSVVQTMYPPAERGRARSPGWASCPRWGTATDGDAPGPGVHHAGNAVGAGSAGPGLGLLPASPAVLTGSPVRTVRDSV